MLLWADMEIKYNIREYDEGLLQKIPEISYEDEFKDIPSPPDVSNYLASEVSIKCLCRIMLCRIISVFASLY